MITYGLGTHTIYTGDQQNNPNAPKAGIHIPIGLSKEEYNKVLNAISKVGNIFRYASIFNTTIWNYQDLVNTVHSYEQAFIRKDGEFLGKRDITLNINKEVLNVLTSFRFYVDFTNKNLHKDFGNKSEIIANFKQYCSNEYDNNFSYRLVNQFRNYAQHKGLIVNSITFNKYLDEKDHGTIKHNLSICINRQDLLEDKIFKKEIKTELVNYPEQIDLMEHLTKWMNSLIRIHNQLMNDLIPTGLIYAVFVIDQANRLGYDKNDRRIGPILSIINHPENNIGDAIEPSFVSLPVEDAQRIIEYCNEHNLTTN